MADYNDRLKDYVQVNERIIAFYELYPEGSLQSEIVELTEKRVVMKAYAYRKAGDPLPGIGHSQMSIPGRTSFTIGSEVENCETSAWGRALAALGFEVKRGIATRNEIENKRHEHIEPENLEPEPSDTFQASTDALVTDAQALSVTQWCRSFGVDFKAVFGPWFSVDKPERMTNPQFAIFIEKRDDILLKAQQAATGSKDIPKAEKIIDQTADRIRQQSTNTNDGISEGKQKRLWAICGSNGRSREDTKQVHDQILAQFGYQHASEIPWKGKVYDEMCKAAEEAAE